MRWLVVWLGLVALGGCAQRDLPDLVVRAGSAEELAAFRVELDSRFPATQLAPFNTALNELQLAGMDRGLNSAADRAAAMRAQVDGQSVRTVEILGWQARRARLRGEIAEMSATLERDLQTRERQGTATSSTVANRIQNVQDILTKLRHQLAESEQQLTTWGAAVN